MSGTRKPLTWLITGSSNGFGLALTRQVLASGDNVIATSRNPQRTPELVQEVEAKSNGRWIGLDVCWSSERIAKVIAQAEAQFGGLDVVVNNAAYSILGAVEDVPEDQAKAEFETNFWGALRVVKAILSGMRDRGSGTIVNVSSALGVTSWPACGLYSASKFALEGEFAPFVSFITLSLMLTSLGMSQALAQEVKTFGIRVLIVEPGSFRTNFLAGGAMQIAGPSEPYKSPHPVGLSLQSEHEKNGKQPGDPVKAVQVIYNVVTGKTRGLGEILRLPLGSDCWEAGMKHNESVRKDFEACKEMAFSVQIE
ncbi:hypothetical protein NM208_g3997 [Fusarium decemcellulare]|uniref:Uncharacterized protein n=1 Tax=Fusarium decemcellulare TaxID=57161 RepID=A0ACC1SM16_9HYPO|nr:hypothetical protein NM208_g3997 [Fusarium decemcellulare]